MKKFYAILSLMLFVLSGAKAADLVDVKPVTDKIILLLFDEGYIDKRGYHEPDNADVTNKWALNISLATNLQVYSIISPDDPDYSELVTPVDLGRKSKIHEISQECNWDGLKCQNDYIQYHYIYLELPEAMKDGNEYTVLFSGIADNVDEWTFTYSYKTTRSVAIHLNQLGYSPQAQQKYAYISQWMGELTGLEIDDYSGAQFDIYPLNPDGSLGASLFTGNIEKQKDLQTGGPDNSRADVGLYQNHVQSDVWQCDFSSFNTEGEYILSVERLGCSYPFRIHTDAYHEAFYYTMKAVYFERAIVELPQVYAGKWARPEWTNRNFVYTAVRSMDLTDESGNNQKLNIFQNFDWSVDLSDIHGWYHDAGDWDGYVSHFRVPRSLMLAYELAPDNFTDGELDIPETQEQNGYVGTNIPDILDEAVWLVDYFKNNVGPTGGIFGSRVHPDISTESAAQGITKTNYPDFVFRDCRVDGMPSWEDCTTWIVHGEDPRDSYAFASIAAQYAYNLGIAATKTGQDYSAIISEYTDSALSAYTWASNHTLSGDEDVKLFIENRAAAAAWLYKLTGDLVYLDQLKADLNVKNITSATNNLGESKWAVWAYATIDGSMPLYTATFDATLQSDLISAIKNDAYRTVTESIDKNRSMRMGGNFGQPVWNGQATTPWIDPAMVAYKVCEMTSDPQAQEFLDACYLTADYFLGGNQLNYVWLTGVGHEHPKLILHLDSRYDGVEEMIPGVPPYSPRTICDWMQFQGNTCEYGGPWDNDFCLLDGRLYPQYYNEGGTLQWPVHELYFDNHMAPAGTEFTIHQNIAPAAMAYGFLTANSASPSVLNQDPEIDISTISTNYTEGDDIDITLVVSDDDKIYRIEFLQNNRLIGSVDSVVTEYHWENIPAGTIHLFAVVHDNLGQKTKSDTIVLQVASQPDAPQIQISAPADGKYIVANQQVQFEFDVTGTASKVLLLSYNDTISESTEAPFSMSVVPDEPGYYLIRAIAIDESNGLRDEAIIVLNVADGVILNSLNISEGQLNPQFDPEIKMYEVMLEKSVEDLPEVTASTDLDASIDIIDANGFDQRIWVDTADRTTAVWVVMNDKSDSVEYKIVWSLNTGLEGYAADTVLFESFGEGNFEDVAVNYTDFDSKDIASFLSTDSVSINNYFQNSPAGSGASGPSKLWLTRFDKEGDTLHFVDIDVSEYTSLSGLSFWSYANTSWNQYFTKSPSVEVSFNGSDYQKLYVQTETTDADFNSKQMWGFAEFEFDIPVAADLMTLRIGSFDNQQWMIDDLLLKGLIGDCYSTLRSLTLNSGTIDFDPDVLTYDVSLPVSTTDVPVTTALPTIEGASVQITDAVAFNQELNPDPADRTTTIMVENCGKMSNYQVVFRLVNDDATLSDLRVDNNTVAEFDPQMMNYNVLLPFGTTEVPVVSAVKNDPNATLSVTQAISLPGSAEIVVVAEDGVESKVYTVNFTVATDVYTVTDKRLTVYPNPAESQIIIESNSIISGIEVIDMIGKIIRSSDDIVANMHTITISDVEPGLYMVQVIFTDNTREVIEFIKK